MDLPGWTVDGLNWKSFTSLGRNWDLRSVDWRAPVPTTIIAAKHETKPPGEIYVTTDGGITWKKLAICWLKLLSFVHIQYLKEVWLQLTATRYTRSFS